MKFIKKLFPPKNSAMIRIYGNFDDRLESRVLGQIDAAARMEDTDGFCLLINSQGGDRRVQHTIMNTLHKYGLPCMGFVENEAYSCASQLLLFCQYRVATPFALIMFHSGTYETKGGQLLDPVMRDYVTTAHIIQEESYLRQFAKATGKTMRETRAIYRSNHAMTAPHAVKLGVLHETTELIPSTPRAISEDDILDLILDPETPAK